MSLVFINASIDDYQTLIDGLEPGTEYHLIDARSDGVAQIAARLQGRTAIDALHIIAHGNPGELYLGNAVLSRDTLAEHAEQLAQIGQSLGDAGDILLYGCEVGKGESGRAFVAALREGFGAHVAVAAAAGRVGHADLSGSWNLDVGQVPRKAPLALTDWRGTLSFTALSGTDAAAALTMAEQVKGTQSGLSIISAQYVGAVGAASTFDTLNLGSVNGVAVALGSGVLLTSGDGLPALSNTSSSYTVGNFTAGDSGLDAYAAAAFSGAGTTQDAAILEISFTVSALADGSTPTKVSLDFMFGSDEYPEYSDTTFVDIAAIEVDGVNYAYFNQDTAQPLSVINANLTLGNFIDNQAGVLGIEYDGISSPLRITTSLAAGLTTHTIRIAIADTGDTSYDSGIFVSNLKTSSFNDLPDGIYIDGETIVIPGDKGDSIFGTDDDDTIEGGTGSDSVFGGEGDDTIDAGEGNDSIEGGAGNDTIDGGAGADKMEGGLGADLYYVDNKKDVVLETSNEPSENTAPVLSLDLGSTIDSVVSSVKYTLTNYVENLTLADSAKKLAGTGNDLGNVITGNSGSNKLSGKEGADTIDGAEGADKISGGDSADTFAFSNLAEGGADAISDFADEDILAFDVSVFTQLAGATADNLAFGTAAVDANDYLIYSDKGILAYDADGSGSASSAIKIVALKGADAKSIAFDDLGFF